MCLEDSQITDQDLENMFGVYIKKVIARSRKRFDSVIRARSEHEEFILNTATQGFAEDNISQLEDESFIMEENIDIDPLRLENAFIEEYVYKAVKELSSKQKYILFCIFFQDISEQETADIFGLTRQSVNKIKQTALKKIMSKYIELESQSVYKQPIINEGR